MRGDIHDTVELPVRPAVIGFAISMTTEPHTTNIGTYIVIRC